MFEKLKEWFADHVSIDIYNRKIYLINADNSVNVSKLKELKSDFEIVELKTGLPDNVIQHVYITAVEDI